jgi:3',5'-cyclic AMP phosphodiesterase CpdA
LVQTASLSESVEMFRIAHMSDLHVLSHTGAQWRAMLFNKRITGYANTVWRRGRVHRREYLLAVLEAASKNVDHVVVTGDITNLALESEYEDARSLLSEVARSVEVTVVPGNHDIYLPAIVHERRFRRYFNDFLSSDLPQFALDLPAGPFPCVKLRGPAAIIAVSSGVPRPPFVAAGFVGEKQLDALAGVLAHPDVARRTPVILIHHPPVDRRNRLAQLRDGLVDGSDFRRVLAPLARGLVLFGHLHVRLRCVLQTPAGALDVVAASGAALDHPDLSVRAGFNRYDIDDDGNINAMAAQVLDRPGLEFQHVSIAERTGCT